MTSYGEMALVRGMSFLAEKQASIANNLANVDTTSFKRRTAVADDAGAFQTMLDQQMSAIRYVEGTDMQRGVIRETGGRFDVAIDGPHWLRVRDSEGRDYLTRNGQLQLAADGRLATSQGMSVLDAGGAPINLGAGEESPTEITFSPNGTIVDPRSGRTFGTLAMVQVPDQQALIPVGRSLYVDQKQQRTTQAGDGLQQGFLEGSNVDSLQELVQMIAVERSFGASQKALSGIGRLQSNMISNILR
jgi:flagellar basal-body rod protein FlgF